MSKWARERCHRISDLWFPDQTDMKPAKQMFSSDRTAYKNSRNKGVEIKGRGHHKKSLLFAVLSFHQSEEQMCKYMDPQCSHCLYSDHIIMCRFYAILTFCIQNKCLCSVCYVCQWWFSQYLMAQLLYFGIVQQGHVKRQSFSDWCYFLW